MADGAATRRLRRLRRSPALLASGAVLAGLSGPAAAQSLFGGDDFIGPAGGLARPTSPFISPLQPGQSATPGFWQPEFLPDLSGPPPAGAPPQPWSFNGSVLGRASYTDNVRNSPTNPSSDLFFTLVPRVTVAADTANLVGAITYAPRMSYYLDNPNQNRIDQFFGGQGLGTVVKDVLFVEFSATGDVQSVFGDFVGADLAQDNDNNRVQTTAYRISPYVQHRFGNVATARVGYAFRQVIQDGNAAFEDGQATPFFVSTGYTTNQFYGNLRSGESFGRFGWTLAASSTDFSGDNVYDGAYNRVYGAQLRYAITREIAALVDGGWQESFYNGATPYRVEDPIWSVGLRYQPDEASFLTLRYGQYDGQTSWFLRGGLDVGVRTRMFVNYSESLSNSGLQTGDSLSSLRVDALGNLVDNGTGTPAAVAFGSPLQNVQSGIFLQKRASVALSHVLSRDTFSVGLSWQENDPVAIAEGTQPFSQTTRSVGVGWNRSLDAITTLTAAARYGLSESQNTSGEQANYSLSAGLSRALSPRLFATLRYEFTSRETNQLGGRSERNTISVALRQAF